MQVSLYVSVHMANCSGSMAPMFHFGTRIWTLLENCPFSLIQTFKWQHCEHLLWEIGQRWISVYPYLYYSHKSPRVSFWPLRTINTFAFRYGSSLAHMHEHIFDKNGWTFYPTQPARVTRQFPESHRSLIKMLAVPHPTIWSHQWEKQLGISFKDYLSHCLL